jgi:HPt (histidine-containing phosphotransfer) domain-containing protein
MEAAWSERDFAALAALAHWLKGAGGTVGYDVFTEPAKTLEQLAQAHSETEIPALIGQLRALNQRLTVPQHSAGVPASPPAAGSPLPAAGGLRLVARQDSPPPEGPVVSRLADRPRLRATVRQFAQRLGGNLQAMEAARQQGDLVELARLAHWLKGAGGTVGYDAFTEPAACLEQCAKAGSADQIQAVLAELNALAARMVVPKGDEVAGAAG